MATWLDLDEELKAWETAGRTATLWWRDDDAAQATPALERLLELATRVGHPVHIAAVPAQLDADLARALDGLREVRVLQHGYAHVNYAAKGEDAAELGWHREKETLFQELAEGWSRLRDAGLPRLLPVLVPPWNRIAAELLAHLPGLGYRMVSTFKARSAREAASGLLQVNAHCDPIRWRQDARFCGTESALEAIVRHLAARRSGAADAEEPTGLLTHHLQTDAPGWAFLEELMDRTAARRCARWIGLESLMGA